MNAGGLQCYSSDFTTNWFDPNVKWPLAENGWYRKYFAVWSHTLAISKKSNGHWVLVSMAGERCLEEARPTTLRTWNLRWIKCGLTNGFSSLPSLPPFCLRSIASNEIVNLFIDISNHSKSDSRPNKIRWTQYHSHHPASPLYPLHSYFTPQILMPIVSFCMCTNVDVDCYYCISFYCAQKSIKIYQPKNSVRKINFKK